MDTVEAIAAYWILWSLASRAEEVSRRFKAHKFERVCWGVESILSIFLNQSRRFYCN
jgi:hypothetical protein